jgi:spoIIIJ-associated protein
VNVPQSIEAVGNTIEDAIARGLEALNAERRNVEIEVLTTTAREARVRLTIKARSDAPGAPTVEAAPASPSDTPEATGPDDDAAIARRLLTALLDNMRLKAEVEVRQVELLSDRDRQEEPTLVLNIRGSDLGVLIGRRGETLEDLQYLTRLLVAKALGRYINLVLDVEGYKSHREQTLQQLAQRMAERVVASHKPASLEPMPANERRIIHLTLRDHPLVQTESIGSGEDRKVTIVPKSVKH